MDACFWYGAVFGVAMILLPSAVLLALLLREWEVAEVSITWSSALRFGQSPPSSCLMKRNEMTTNIAIYEYASAQDGGPDAPQARFEVITHTDGVTPKRTWWTNDPKDMVAIVTAVYEESSDQLGGQNAKA